MVVLVLKVRWGNASHRVLVTSIGNTFKQNLSCYKKWGDAEEAKAPLDFKLMLLCVQAVTAEGSRKFILE